MIEAKIYERDRELFDALKAMPENERRSVLVQVVPFNARALNVFQRIGVKTLGQLQAKSRFDLMREQGMGELSYSQVSYFMSELGLPMAIVPVVQSPDVVDPHSLQELIQQMREILARMEAKIQ